MCRFSKYGSSDLAKNAWRICGCLLSILFFSAGCEHGVSADETDLDKNIDLVATSDKQWTGVAVSASSRLFVCYPNWSASHTFSVAELSNGSTALPYPDEEWNTWKEGLDPARHFICVQSVFIDRNDYLWILDPAYSERNGTYTGVVEGGAKLLKFDLKTNTLIQTIIFKEPVIKKTSYLNDVRIHEDKNMAYITDSGEGALIVVDLKTGTARRMLATLPVVKSENRTLVINGVPFVNEHGVPPMVHSDGIALNASRTYLYWRPLTGESLYRISTDYISDPVYDDTALSRHIEHLGYFPPSDGMIFGFYNDLYLASVEDNAIRAYDHGNETRLVRQRDDLQWPDSFSVGADGYLYFTTSQMQIIDPVEPYKLFKIKIRF